MIYVQLTEWKPGLRKISLTKLLQRYAGLSLTDAKDLVDRYVAGDVVTVPVRSQLEADCLARESADIGAIARVRRDSIVST